jgi:acyl-homoserine lactone acylase PvdQ
MIWDIKDPRGGKWVFPVGQSGHVASSHYRDFHDHWISETYVPILPDTNDWEFVVD